MAELAEALYALPTETLRRIVENRQIPPVRFKGIESKSQLAALLAAELSQTAGVTRALMQCDVRALRLLQVVIAAERPTRVPWPHVLDQIGQNVPEEPLIKTMDRLQEIGLAFRTLSGIVVPDTVRHHTPTPLSDRTSIIRALSIYDPESVKRLAENLGIESAPRQAAVAAIRDELTSIRIHGIIDGLDTEETRVLEYLIRAGGTAQPSELTEVGVGGESEEFFRYDWQKRWRSGKPRNAIDRLLSIGLIYVINYGYGYNLYLVIPHELMRLFSGGTTVTFWTSPEPKAEEISGAPHKVRRHTGIIRDAVSFLAFIATQDAARTSTGHIHKAALRTAARSMSIPTDRYAAFVYVVCRTAGLIEVQPQSPIYQVANRGEAWLEWDSVDQLVALVTGWRKSSLWDEMFQDPLQKEAQRGRQHDTTLARNAAIALACEPPGDHFVALDSLAATIRFRLPLLMMEIGEENGSDRVLSPSDFISVIVGESLYWLGIAELASFTPAVAAGGAAEATGVRIPHDMRYFLDSVSYPRPQPAPTESHFVLQANAEVFVSPMLAPALLYRVLSYSEPVSKGAASNTVVLSRDAIRRSFDRGETVREMLAFLQSHSRAGIPQNVEYLINEVGARHGHIHIGRAQMYLQTDSATLMKELHARRELKPLFVRTLSDTVAILSTDEADRVLRDLRKAGYLPVSDDAAPKPGARGGKKPQPHVTGPGTARIHVGPPVNWTKIAEEDSRTVTPSTGPPRDAAHERTMIRLLIQNVAKAGRPVQLAYQPADEAEPIIREVIPTLIRGGSVLVMDISSNESVQLELNRIQWARVSQ